MHTLRLLTLTKDPVWANFTSFSIILFFILLGDAILSFWVPNFLQDSLGNSFLMGLTMSFSSMVGFLADLIFPQALKGFTVRRLIFSAIIVSFSFILSLAIGVSMPIMVIFLVAMAFWGIYYEYLHFAQAQFVADTVPYELRASGWGILGIFRNLAYFLGPIIAGLLVLRGGHFVLLFAAIFVGVGFLFFLITKKRHERPISIEVSEVSIFREMSHWKVLTKRVWPIVIVSLLMGLIDATFWTTGAVWAENLTETNFLGALILPAYQLPALFMGAVIARLGIYKGKKRLSEKFLLLSGLTLIFLSFDLPIVLYVLVVLVSSVFLSVTYPLVEAVYTDITVRMGVARKHLVGLSASTISLAYIISPAIAGLIANFVGEKATFVVVGVIVSFFSLILLFVTPKKLRLPENEIGKWND